MFVPFRRVYAPVLSEEQISKLMDGLYVEGEFGLEEGDVFYLGGERMMCYRMMGEGRCRVRRMKELSGFRLMGDRGEDPHPHH